MPPTRAETDAFLAIQAIMVEPVPTTIVFRYVDENGNVSERRVEPYEIKAGVLFAHDLDRDATRRFKLSGISNVLAGTTFKPRFPMVIPMSP